jgi:hypothetical protein
MNKYIVLYHGPTTAPNAQHEGWPEWFKKIGSNLVAIGSPMTTSMSVSAEGVSSPSNAGLNGYSIISASDIEQAAYMLKDHPYTRLGDEYTIEVFEAPKS